VLLAQVNNEVKTTHEIKVIDGKKYYIHVVKKSETLYSISKNYGLSVRDIVSENPESLDGIKVGQELKIPVTPSEVKEIARVESDSFVYHIVQQGQTLYYISKTYNVEESLILQSNPELNYSSLQIGQVVKIPKLKHNMADTTVVKMVQHKVKAKETLYSISRLYNVKVSAILEANPQLQGRGLKDGETINIPTKAQVKVARVFAVKDTVAPLHKNDTISLQVELCDTVSLHCSEQLKHIKQKSISIALILPFYLAENEAPSSADTTQLKDENEDGEHSHYMSTWLYPKSANFIEFYEGTLLAVDSLKRLGLQVDLHVFDCGRDTNRIKEILRKPVLKQVDFIMGPVFWDELEIVADFAEKNGITVISPLSTRSGQTVGNPQLIQVNPSQNTELRKIASFISENYKPNILLICNNDSVERLLVKTLDSLIRASLSQMLVNIDSFQMRTIILNGRYDSVVMRSLNKERPNLVVLPSDNEAFVADMVTNLNLLSQSTNITVFGMPTWWKIANVDMEYFFNLKVHYCSPFYIDYSQPAVVKFLSSYRQKYGFEPYKVTSQGYNFAMLGYDLTLYFSDAIRAYGKDLHCCLPTYRRNMLLSDYNFGSRSKNNGLENSTMYIVSFGPDYNVQRTEIKN
jgi:LysM repeat protein/ABC-type branched-subunit amino acid transport system substrate-binding protein